MDLYIYPNEELLQKQHELASNHWEAPKIIELLKSKAKTRRLWQHLMWSLFTQSSRNLFLPDSSYGAGLSNFEYAYLCEIMGRSLFLAPEVFNCSAPDTGNMVFLVKLVNQFMHSGGFSKIRFRHSKENISQTSSRRLCSIVLCYDWTIRRIIRCIEHFCSVFIKDSTYLLVSDWRRNRCFCR